MKPRLFAAMSLAAFWLFILLALLQHSSPAISSAALLTSAAPLDIVINEVAWAGTSVSTTADEWIELKNNTAFPITLTGWTLTNTGSINIVLVGVVPAHGYFMLERSDDNTISDILADQIFSNALLNPPTPDFLVLRDNTGIPVDTANGNGGTWPAGSAGPNYYSMERVDPLAPDTDGNWASNDGVIRNGHDANGNLVNGTPRSHNSATSANLGITQLAPSTSLMNRAIQYTLIFSNAGKLNVKGAIITDTLSFSPISVIQTSPYTFTQVGQNLVWQVGTLLTASGNLSLTFTVTPATDFTGLLTSTAFITSEVVDYYPADDLATATTQVVPPSADVSVSKSAPATATAGSEIAYLITISNPGQIEAPGVRLTDTLPLSATFVSAAGTPAQPVNGTLVWTLGALPAGGQPISLTVIVTTAQDVSGWLTNRVTLTTVSSETVTVNNSAYATTLVTTTSPPPARPGVLISAVHYHGYNSYNDEAIQLTNVEAFTVSLMNWRLSEGNSTGAVTFPAFDLAPGQRTWATNHADAFYAMFGEWPDFARVPTGSVLSLTGTWLSLPNDSGADIKLADASGALRDRLLYGSATTMPGGGWDSAAVQPYTPTTAFAREGQILYRKLDKATGLPGDTDTSADWAQDRADPITGRRVRYPGWNLERFYRTVQITETARLTVGIAPDNAFQVISQVIASAQQTLTIEVYSFENAALAELLGARARAGVSVTLLLEGEPAGGLTDQEKWSCQQVEEAGGACWFMFNDTGRAPKVYDRYSNQHAKVIVADDRLAAIGSENLSPRSLPNDDKSDGTAGERGVVLVTDAPGVVQAARKIWSADFDPGRFRDLVRWSSSDTLYGPPPVGFAPITVTGGTTYTVLFPQPVVLSGTFPFEVIQSPENSLRQSDSLLGLIGRAGPRDEMAVEQLQEPPHWGPASGTPSTDPNVYLEALIAAASRGARVRLLLDSYYDDGDNAATVAYIESLRAVSETLRANLHARTGNPTASGIHNKMVLAFISGRGYVHVGSLNHGELAAKGNREVALQVQSDAAYAYLRRMFDSDWYRVYLPIVMQNYAPPSPPADYGLISEVYYSSTVTKQWVEIYNPTLRNIDLSDYKIGDAESPDKFEGMYRFPAGTVLGPRGVMVIAFDATQVPQANLQMCPTCGGNVPVMNKYPGWGTGDWWLAGHGDQVLLLGPGDVPLDVVVYGDASHPGVIAHPGVNLYTHSLERFPANQDTNNCALDFRDRFPPTPGQVP